MGSDVPIGHVDVSPGLAVASVVLLMVLLRPLLLGSSSTIDGVVTAGVVGATVLGVAVWMRRYLR